MRADSFTVKRKRNKAPTLAGLRRQYTGSDKVRQTNKDFPEKSVH